MITSETYKTYEKVSRYASFPIYYNTEDDKWIGGITKYLSSDADYSTYTVKQGDSYDRIALYYYNNPTYYWIICSFNRIQDPFLDPEVGSVLKIPTLSSISYSYYQ